MLQKLLHALVHLQKQFYDKITSRIRCEALVWGDFEQDEGTITGNIGRSLKNRKVMDVFPEGDEYGRHAVTHYTVLERFGYVTLVECRLETERHIKSELILNILVTRFLMMKHTVLIKF